SLSSSAGVNRSHQITVPPSIKTGVLVLTGSGALATVASGARPVFCSFRGVRRQKSAGGYSCGLGKGWLETHHSTAAVNAAIAPTSSTLGRRCSQRKLYSSA